MARFYGNRVAFNTTTTGTGTISVGTVLGPEFILPIEATGIATGANPYLLILDGDDFEICDSTFTDGSPDTLSRDTVLISKIGGTVGTSKINLSGSATVRFLTPAEAQAFVLKSNATANLTAGFTATSYSGGTITGSNQTYTPDAANGNFQHITLNGSSLTGTFTFAAPSGVSSIVVQVTNGGSGAVAATLSTSGYTKVTGDTYTTTNGNDFLFFITKSNGFSHLHIQALQ